MSILKWVGGKNQILNELKQYIPIQINTYYELFIGGGSVLIELLEMCERNEISILKFVANDINSELINLYNNIKNNHLELIECLNNIDLEFKKLPEIKTEKRKKIIPPQNKTEIENRKVYYYFIRNQFNNLKLNVEVDILKSAYFIFLNKTGFRGLYRENSKKQYNVPYGNYKNPKILNKNQIIRLNYLFNEYNVIFTNKNFTDLIKLDDLMEEDFVYMDPPYYPFNKNSFTSFSAINFDLLQHKHVIKLIKSLDNIGVKFLLSNSYTDWIINKSKKFNQKKICCKRRINSKNPNSVEYEILVYN